MSYCRSGKNSDLYVYGGKEGLVCCSCRLSPTRKSLVFPYEMDSDTEISAEENMLEHILLHVSCKNKVPIYAIMRLGYEAFPKFLSRISHREEEED